MRSNAQLLYHACKIVELLDRVIQGIHTINEHDFKDIVVLGKNHFTYGVKSSDFHVAKIKYLYITNKLFKKLPVGF